MEPTVPPLDLLRGYSRALSTALGFRDPSTLLHSERVQGLALKVGSRLGLEVADLGLLEVAAAFHDIGKIGIRDAILLKPARLDEDEWDVMRRHADMGAQIIAATGVAGADRVARVIRHHHEHYDGGGYPDGLFGESIPLLSRIVSVVDGYDAMVERRSYHGGRSHPAVLEVLQRERGRKYDPVVLDAFLEIVASG